MVVEVESPLSTAEEAFARDRATWWDAEGGYAHLQATKPRTPAFALNDFPPDSPAWIAESSCSGKARPSPATSY